MGILTRAANIVGKPFGINPFPRAFANAGTKGTSDRALAFDNIYTSSAWNSSESVSGPGSEHARASGYRDRLKKRLQTLGVRSIFDAPCGDLNWILPAVDELHYRGADISPSLIEKLRRQHPTIDLSVFDICADRFPPVDVWHCRDCLFHLPFADIEKALRGFAESTISYALITSHRTKILHKNLDIPVGGWRYLDLNKAPISLPQPEFWLRDYAIGTEFPRYVGGWRREQIAAALR